MHPLPLGVLAVKCDNKWASRSISVAALLLENRARPSCFPPAKEILIAWQRQADSLPACLFSSPCLNCFHASLKML